MLRRLTRDAFVLAAAATLAFSGAVLADSVAADGDQVTADVQTFVDLGTVAPGATVSRDVTMTLFCSGLNHVDPGQVVNLSQFEVTVPVEGGSISATSTTVGPVPAGWANDMAGRSGCSGPMHIDSSVPSHVTIVAPTTPGIYGFSVTYARTLTPAGVSDGSSVTGFTIVSFSIDVEDLDSTPPTLVGMPAGMDLVTADPAGTVLDYALPTATDDVDPAPAVSCAPPSGGTFPVGVTTVTCTATDASGNSASATFEVVVHLGSVEWGDPVGDQTELTVSLGRSLPLKARAWLDGLPLAGPASFEVWSCAARSASPVLTAAAAWQADADRWMTVLDTSVLAVGCHTVALLRDGTALGSFTLQVVDPPVPGPAGYRGSNRSR